MRTGFAVFALVCLSTLVMAETVVLQDGVHRYFGTHDASLRGNPARRHEWAFNTGGSKMLVCANRGNPKDPSRDIGRILMKFDLPGFTRGMRIQSATLEMYCMTFGNIPQGRNSPIACYLVKRRWNEGRGDEVDAIKGEASWLNYTTPAAWHRSGCDGTGDRDAKALSVVDVNSANAWFAWDVTEAVKVWISGRKNCGLVLRAENEGLKGFRVFHSRESDTVGLRPKLVIHYAAAGPVPLPKTRPPAPARVREAPAAPQSTETFSFSMGKVTTKETSDKKKISIIEGVMDNERLRVRGNPKGAAVPLNRDLVVTFKYYASGPGGKLTFLVSGDKHVHMQKAVTNPRKGSWVTMQVPFKHLKPQKNTPDESTQVRLLNWYMEGATAKSKFMVMDIKVIGTKPKPRPKEQPKPKPQHGVREIDEGEEF